MRTVLKIIAINCALSYMALLGGAIMYKDDSDIFKYIAYYVVGSLFITMFTFVGLIIAVE